MSRVCKIAELQCSAASCTACSQTPQCKLCIGQAQRWHSGIGYSTSGVMMQHTVKIFTEAFLDAKAFQLQQTLLARLASAARCWAALSAASAMTAAAVDEGGALFASLSLQADPRVTC